MLNNKISHYIKRISNVLLLNIIFVDNIEFLIGKTGIAIFFLNYIRFKGNNFYKEYSKELLDVIIKEVYQNLSINYIIGFAGLSTEYLVKNEFIETDANEVLEEMDILIQHHTDHHLPKSIDKIYEICFIDTYFEAQLNNFNIAESVLTALNEKAQRRIVNMLSKPYNTYFYTLIVIRFLFDTRTLNINKVKAERYLNNAIDKLETSTYEDVHFGTFSGTFKKKIILVSDEIDFVTLIKRLISGLDLTNKHFRNAKKKARRELTGRLMGRKSLDRYKKIIVSSIETIQN